jgi:hypothetical protein
MAVFQFLFFLGMKGKVIEENLGNKEQNIEADNGNRKQSESSVIEAEIGGPIGSKTVSDKGDRRVSFDLRSDVEEPTASQDQADHQADDHELFMTDVFPNRDHQEANQR